MSMINMSMLNGCVDYGGVLAACPVSHVHAKASGELVSESHTQTLAHLKSISRRCMPAALGLLLASWFST